MKKYIFFLLFTQSVVPANNGNQWADFLCNKNSTQKKDIAFSNQTDENKSLDKETKKKQIQEIMSQSQLDKSNNSFTKTFIAACAIGAIIGGVGTIIVTSLRANV